MKLETLQTTIIFYQYKTPRRYFCVFNSVKYLTMKQFLKINTVILLVFCAAAMDAQTAHKELRQADKSYKSGNYANAEANYRKALEKDNSTKGNYNLGNSTYRQERFDESVKHYQAAAEAAKDRTTKARAYHNLGNAHYQKGQYKESVDAYKNALRQNPNDIETKRNLTNALRRLPPPPPQQQDQQNQKGENKDKKDQKDQKDQQQQDQQNQEEQKDQQQNDKQRQNSNSKEQPQDLSKQEAKELLEIMDQEEQKVQQKLKKAQAKKGRTSKDW
jgi:Ca-activated chloride channel family protein